MAQKKSDILESLISQLEKKQADISCFLDLIDDYMALYDIKKKLKTDIKKRGVSYEAQSASGKATIIKQNQSVKDLVAVNKQMLMILDKLGLTTEKTIKMNIIYGTTNRTATRTKQNFYQRLWSSCSETMSF